MRNFEPDYRNIVQAARNVVPTRLPLYEHLIGVDVMEDILGRKFGDLYGGGHTDKVAFFRAYCEFFRRMGYDTASFECCFGATLPGTGSLGNHKPGEITSRADFDRYPWDELPAIYAKAVEPVFLALEEALPPGMKAVGGVGNGVFECVQEIVGFEDLCFVREDDPELYAALFEKMGEALLSAWRWLFSRFPDVFCVCRMGDDLGFKCATLLAPDDLRRYVFPQYKKIVAEVHAHGKPFLLHSCGCIFDVMEDLIGDVGIDAKHSNEDVIAPFPVWVERYGDRIGNFGGIDTDALCRLSRTEMREYIHDVLRRCVGHGGLAFASGNSIPRYVPTEGYLNMIEIVRTYRGER